MSWSYNPADLVTSTASGRLNIVRLLIGDTDETEQILQDEEIVFSLDQTNNNVYYAGSWACRIVAAKFSRLVDTTIDSAGSSRYSHRIDHFTMLAQQLSDLGKKTYGKSLGLSAGGISNTAMDVARSNTDRPDGFYVGQFDNLGAGTYSSGYYSGV
jgi:hypothetical protein